MCILWKYFKYKNPQVQKSAERVDFFTDTARYVYGDAILVGFFASLTYLIVGGLLLWKRDNIREFRKYTGKILTIPGSKVLMKILATNYSFTAGKPLLNGTQKLNASFFNNSSKNIPGPDSMAIITSPRSGPNSNP